MKNVFKKTVLTALTVCLTASLFQPFASKAAEPGQPDDNVVVVLDPGHGGSDPGACREINGGSYYERDLVLKIANYCKEELEKAGGYTVYLTRTDNTSPLMSREQRAEFAKQREADALVSFHLNATAADITTAVTGALVYYPNGNYNSILGSAGNLIASSILKELVSLGLADNGVQIWNAKEDRYPDGSVADYLGINYWSKLKGFPGVLIEHAFINNPNDVAGYLSTEEQLKSLGIADARGIINYFNSGQAFRYVPTETGSWQLNNYGWWYRRTDGSYPANAWENINGSWYLFNASGYMVTGWQYVNGAWYYMNPSGAMTTGWQYINGTWYYMRQDGVMTTGWQQIDGTWYYMNGSGAMQTGWQLINGGWFYLQPGGAMTTGWQYINGAWYYLHESGVMLTGWQQIGDQWYYLKPNGIMATGWQLINGAWYYLQPNGAMATGWLGYGSSWYYLNANGTMATGWQQIGDQWYYMNPGGSMAADTWVDGFYLNGSGIWAQ